MNKKVSVLIVVLLLVLGIFSYFMIKSYNNKKIVEEKEKLMSEVIEIKKRQDTIKSHYNDVVITNKNSDLYKLEDKKYKKIGNVSEEEILKLDGLDFNNGYLHIKDLDLYIKYLDVDKYNDVVDSDNRYKNYIEFNENVVSKEKVNLYRDDKLVYTFDYSIDKEIIIKDEDGFYIEYLNELLFIKNDDILKTYEKNNSNDVVLKELPITVYHFIYLNGDNSCNEMICHSEEQIKSHFEYLKNNNYFTMNTKEARLFLEEKIRLPRNSILITIDDGARAENFIPIMEKYGINATLFLISSWYPVDKFKSNYLEIASHTDDLHHPGLCSGGQGSPLKCLDKNKLVNDLKLSRSKLNNTEAFCFPFYEYNEHGISSVKEAGFKIAFIGGQIKAKIGVDLYKVPRITIHRDTSLNQYINYIK